jgi:hypothetical protein
MNLLLLATLGSEEQQDRRRKPSKGVGEEGKRELRPGGGGNL